MTRVLSGITPKTAPSVQSLGGLTYVVATISAGGELIRLSSAGYQPDGFHAPNIFQDPDFGESVGDFNRSSLIVLNEGPFYVNGSMLEGFGEVLRTVHLVGGMVELQSKYKNPRTTADGIASNYKIIGISNHTAATTTLQLELASQIEREVPRYKVNNVEFPGFIIDDSAVDKAIPIALGEHFPSLPEAEYGGVTADQSAGTTTYHSLITCGMRPKGSPAVWVQQGATRNSFTWQEKHPNGLIDEPIINVGGLFQPYVYSRSNDAYAYVPGNPTQPDGIDNLILSNDLANGKASVFYMHRTPWLTMPILCDKANLQDSVGLTDGELAIDGKPDTWARVDYSSDLTAGARWFLPSPQKLGRLSRNSSFESYDPDPGNWQDNNFEGDGVPPGIVVFAVLVVPEGELAGGSDGNIRLRVKTWNAQGSGWNLFGQSTTDSYEAVPGIPQIITLPLRSATSLGAYGTEGDGWLGTRFENWELMSGDAATGPSYFPGYHTPFSVEVVNRRATQEPIFVPYVGVRFTYQSSKSVPGDEIETGAYINPLTDEVIARWADPGRQAAPSEADADNSYTSKIIFANNGLIDDGSYGDSGEPLRNPAQFVQYIASTYNSEEIATDGPGRLSQANSILDAWTDMVEPGSIWRSSYSASQQKPGGSHIEAITRGLPAGSNSLVSGDGKRRLHVWIPDESLFTKWRSGGYFSPTQILGSNGDEGLELEFWVPPISEVRNEFHVRYDWDYGRGEPLRTATLTQDASDDGYGNPWPASPGVNSSMTSLCQWSRVNFGTVRKFEIDLVGVNDRATAVAIGWSHALKKYNPFPRCRFLATPDAHDLTVGTSFRFDNELERVFGYKPSLWGDRGPGEDGYSWEDTWFRVLAVEEIESNGRIYAVEAEFNPTAIGYEVLLGATSGSQVGDPSGAI